MEELYIYIALYVIQTQKKLTQTLKSLAYKFFRFIYTMLCHVSGNFAKNTKLLIYTA